MEPTNLFIIRIWREPREIEGAPSIWRGVIEHVPSGERMYLQQWNNILNFIFRFVQPLDPQDANPTGNSDLASEP
jgi:hypothetical protein